MDHSHIIDHLQILKTAQENIARAQKQAEDAQRNAQEAGERAQKEIKEASRAALEVGERCRGAAEELIKKVHEEGERNIREAQRVAQENLEDLRKRTREAREKAQKIEETEGSVVNCPVCKKNQSNALLGCGHKLCQRCCNCLVSCFRCGEEISLRVVEQ